MIKGRIRNNVRKLRFLGSEMTQQELAEKIGVTRQTVIAIEQDKYSPSLEVAFRIARVFGVPLEEVFQYETADSDSGSDGVMACSFRGCKGFLVTNPENAANCSIALRSAGISAIVPGRSPRNRLPGSQGVHFYEMGVLRPSGGANAIPGCWSTCPE